MFTSISVHCLRECVALGIRLIKNLLFLLSVWPSNTESCEPFCTVFTPIEHFAVTTMHPHRVEKFDFVSAEFFTSACPWDTVVFEISCALRSIHWKEFLCANSAYFVNSQLVCLVCARRSHLLWVTTCRNALLNAFEFGPVFYFEPMPRA